jgi:Rad3-related DNA helicase
MKQFVGPDDVFPFPSFREYQEEVLKDSLDELQGDTDVLILDVPTGVGKSGVCVGLCRAANDAYYTTPQRELRLQLQEDDVLSHHFHTLEARSDYICRETGDNCEECDFFSDPDLSCNEYGRDCTYMREVSDTMQSQTSVLTMSRLLIAGQKDFNAFLEPRELLVVDEAQSLEDQVASMHANIEVTEDTLPAPVFATITEDIESPDDDEAVLTHEDVWSEIIELQGALHGFIDSKGDDSPEEALACKRMLSSLEWMRKEAQDDRTWVVSVDDEDRPVELEMKPVEVDRWLRRFFWSMCDKIVLSTATVPYRANPDIWLDQLGLGNREWEMVSCPSPFDPTNRMVHTRWELGKMSDDEDVLWSDVMQALNNRASAHEGEKGLVHTASYDRAQRIADEQDDWEHLSGNVMADQQGEQLTERWQRSDKDIMCSPSMVEGVDLEGDRCRWQVLLKVPYAHPDDPRIQHMLNQGRWYWYFQKSGVKILQSVGRAVRSRDDEADYYVFDGSFEDVRQSVKFPDWFRKGIA